MKLYQKHIFCIIGMIWGICLQLTASLPTILQQPESAPKQHFKITVQNSGKQPHSGMILRILGQSDEFVSNSNGVFDFEAENPEGTYRSVSLYFPETPQNAAYSFQLNTITSDTILVIDREQDILSFKQNNTIFPIRGQIKNQSGTPIAKAQISIQGTGRKTQSDASGRFTIAADYNHPIVFRAEGMKNQTLNIQYFLSNSSPEPAIYMQPQNTYQVYTTVEKMPEFPGGMKAFQQYVQKNLPAKTAKEKGVVVIQFIVEKDGSITNPTVARGFKTELDSISLNLVRNMPKWIPGEEDQGNKVRCKYSVPIQFKPQEAREQRTQPSRNKPVQKQAVKPAQPALTEENGPKTTPEKVQTNDSIPAIKPMPNDTIQPKDSVVTDSVPPVKPKLETVVKPE